MGPEDWMFSMVRDVVDRYVIDLGSGEGRFCRMLAFKGARTLGVDLQPSFGGYARSVSYSAARKTSSK